MKHKWLEEMEIESIIHLIHAYDRYVTESERQKLLPMKAYDYWQSEAFNDLVETGEIEDLLEYECDLEEATQEEIFELADLFFERVEGEIDRGEVIYFTPLDWIIEELEIGKVVDEDEREATERFLENLSLYGYLPSDDGLLHLAKADELNRDFVWDDYDQVKLLCEKYRGEVYVSTLLSEGNTVYVEPGWRFVNRLGYYLSDRPLIADGEQIIL